MREIREVMEFCTGTSTEAIVMSDGEFMCGPCALFNHKLIAHDTIKNWRTDWRAAGVQEEGRGYSCCHCGKDIKP